MDTLDGTDWDVIISGTGLPQSLLALALSRSGKSVLHVDRNDYYGGNEAALSLSDAESWVSKHAASSHALPTTFSNAVSKSAGQDTEQNNLGHSRAYSLALAPQLLYARSSLLSALVSSQTHNQLEFQAVGSWFVVSRASEKPVGQWEITRVPGGREDVFQDNTLNLKAKRSLMKFLRFVASSEEQKDSWEADHTKAFSAFLSESFGLPEASHAAIIALTSSQQPSQSVTVADAVPRIARHLSSIGVFGPGFGAVVPKWGGLAEVGQVACRACAVGGGVYVLGKGVDEVRVEDDQSLSVTLGGGEKVIGQWLVGDNENLPASTLTEESSSESYTSESISIISSPLAALFPPTSEGGPTPAGAVILVQSSTDTEPPVHILAHSSDSGECPTGQSVLYASSFERSDSGFSRLNDAIQTLLQSLQEEPPPPRVLWDMQYERRHATSNVTRTADDRVIALKPMPADLTFNDSVLRDVQDVWQQITGADPESFLKFEARESTFDEDGSS
ncbi:unnamed protein product [Zymoseptoria tritici ST99CH_3D1]|uniref:Rab proteins geranylgeranyltransferase n=1 Tax=Zymoseptoria tritici ST99CH_1E4 TaxID=1276532 RepID=A0A2H1GC89_ZYMTR|nr:unnamed protein product [Zymoseptoria tritici ST99CH_1E4]SMR52167.1 unnamed protein product [Zymoseptoria tritici ST99CH_3D1]